MKKTDLQFWLCLFNLHKLEVKDRLYDRKLKKVFIVKHCTYCPTVKQKEIPAE